MAWIAEQLLKSIRDDKVCDCITEERLVMLTGLTPRQVESSAMTLRRNGLIEKTGPGCHKLTGAGKEALKAGARLHSGPKGSWNNGTRRKAGNTLRQRVWRAIVIRRKFTVPEITTLVVDGTERGDPTSNVQKYVRALARAGYLTELKKREACASPTSPGFKRWWLQDGKHTGPLAPVVRNNLTAVYDPNTDLTHDISPGDRCGVRS
jgi:hypothetical protein